MPQLLRALLLLAASTSAAGQNAIACLTSAAGAPLSFYLHNHNPSTGLQAPCAGPLNTLEAAVAASNGDSAAINAAMAGVDTTACCASVTSFNAQSCFCDATIISALGAAVGSAAGSGAQGMLTSTVLPALASRCGFALRMQVAGHCAVITPSPPPPAVGRTVPPSLLRPAAPNASVVTPLSGNESSSDDSTTTTAGGVLGNVLATLTSRNGTAVTSKSPSPPRSPAVARPPAQPAAQPPSQPIAAPPPPAASAAARVVAAAAALAAAAAALL